MQKKTLHACLAGAVSGIANGLFGAGGGMLLVPLLRGLLGLPERDCFTTALAVIFPMSLVSIAVYASHGALSLSLAWPYLIGGFLGGILGGLLFSKIPAKWLHRILGVVILWGGIRLLL